MILAERREGSIKLMAGEGQKGHSKEKVVPTQLPEGNPAKAGLQRGVSGTAAQGPGLHVTSEGMALGLRGDDQPQIMHCFVTGCRQPVAPSRRVPSVAGLAGAGLTIPLALLQTRLGNDLGLKKHNMFLNTLCLFLNYSPAQPNLTGG